MEIVVTDLTRFQNQNLLCLAGINPEDGKCIRPTPYLQSDHCLQQNILPGARLTGYFQPKVSEAPHLEDRYCTDLKKNGCCSYMEFYSILSETRSPSLCAGFGVNLEADQKYFKHDHPPQKSIITIEVDPDDITILNDQYSSGRLKCIFTDVAGNEFRYISVTDYSFSEFAEKEWTDDFAIQDLNDFLMSQKTIMLRIGLTRRYCSPDGRDGYWIQVNGIYSFPEIYCRIRNLFKNG